MNRRFTIIDTDTQRTSVIESTAETVAELKRDLEANGFTVEGKTIQEGISRTEFTSDDSVLPHDVPRNGTTTNDLVFRLTKSHKNIKSGITRGEAYSKIKELGLEETVKQKCGRNFTQCSTPTLISIISEASKTEQTASPDALKRIEKKLDILIGLFSTKDEPNTTKENVVIKAQNDGIPYTQDELDAMFEGL